LAFKAEDAEVSPAGGEIGFGDLVDADVTHGSILLEQGIGNREQGLRAILAALQWQLWRRS